MRLTAAVMTVLVAASLLGGRSASAAGPKPSEVLEFAASEGGHAALVRYFDCDRGQDAYDGVASGSKAWLAVARQLIGDADACYSELLHDALARALVVAPLRILPLIDSSPMFDHADICVPFFPAEAERAEQIAYLQKLEQTLTKVRAPALDKARRACLAEAEQALATIRATPPPPPPRKPGKR